MPHLYNVYEARTNFSRLLEEVIKGKEIFIGKANKLVAKITRVSENPKPRKPGLFKGKMKMLEGNITDPLPPDIMRYFEDPEL